MPPVLASGAGVERPHLGIGEDPLVRREQRETVQSRGGDQQAVRGIGVEAARQTIRLEGDLV